MNWIDLEQVTLRYTLSGSGPVPLVLIHELGGSLESFDALMPCLERDFRVLRYDQRGAGWSEKPRKPFTIADHARDLRQLLDALGLAGPVCLAGVAAGAAIAVVHALNDPAAVHGLALCSPALTVAEDRVRYLVDRSERAMREGMAAIVDASLARSFPPVVRRDRRLMPPTARGSLPAIRWDTPTPTWRWPMCGWTRSSGPRPAMSCARRNARSAASARGRPCPLGATARAIYAEIDSGHIMPVQAPRRWPRICGTSSPA